MRTTRFCRNGTWFTIHSKPDVHPSKEIRLDEYEPLIHEAQTRLKNMKEMSPDLDHRHYIDGDNRYRILSQFGSDEIVINAPPTVPQPIKPKGKKVVYPDLIVPFIRVPDAHGVLLCKYNTPDELNYDGPYELWDPYDGLGDIRENYPYAPVSFTTPNGRMTVTLNNRIKSPHGGFGLPDLVYGPLGEAEHAESITYAEERTERTSGPFLWGGLFYPGYEWLDFEMPGEGYYGIDLASSRWFDYCNDDGNWKAGATTQVTFNGNPVGPMGRGTSTAVDHDITSVGDSYSVMAWGAASNMVNSWACIVRRKVFNSHWYWYPGMYFCEGNAPGVGTVVGEYSGTYYNEFRYIDSFGANKLLDTQQGKNGYGNGFVKMYEIGERTVFAFNFYTPTNNTNLKLAGLAEDGKVTVTDITNLVDKDGNTYTHPYGQNHLGIVTFENEQGEFVIEQEG